MLVRKPIAQPLALIELLDALDRCPAQYRAVSFIVYREDDVSKMRWQILDCSERTIREYVYFGSVQFYISILEYEWLMPHALKNIVHLLKSSSMASSTAIRESWWNLCSWDALKVELYSKVELVLFYQLQEKSRHLGSNIFRKKCCVRISPLFANSHGRSIPKQFLFLGSINSLVPLTWLIERYFIIYFSLNRAHITAAVQFFQNRLACLFAYICSYSGPIYTRKFCFLRTASVP